MALLDALPGGGSGGGGGSAAVGERRAVYDGLGHSVASCASPTRRRLLELELELELERLLSGRRGSRPAG